MLVKLLGAIDLIAGLLLMFGTGFAIPKIILIIFGIILIAKSLINLLKDFASWIDVLCGITFLLLTFVSIPIIIIFILGALILQKGVFSFL